MRRLLVAGLVGGCLQVAPDDADSDGAGARAILVGEVDIDEHCNIVGAREVIMRARQVDCEPCRTFDGDRYSCPATQDTTLLGAEVDADGRYAVEAVVILTTAEEEPQECYAAPGEAPPVLLTSADIESGAHLMLVGTGNPCPE